MRRLVDHVRSNLIAWVALFFAVTGTGVAASRYVITSTSQIRPSVLRSLRTPVVVAASTPKGPKAIIARIRIANPVVSTSGNGELVAIPLVDGTWTQAADQANIVFGQATVTAPASAECNGEGERGELLLEAIIDEEHPDATESDENLSGGVSFRASGSTSRTATEIFEWEPGGKGGTATWLADSTSAAPHKIELRDADGCHNGGHFTIDSVTLDVIGLR
jgi:hypothetical protein